MRFASFFAAALATLTIASPVSANEHRNLSTRDANEVIAAVNNIDSQVLSLRDTLSEMQPGRVVTAVLILTKSLGLQHAVDSASTTISQQDVFNAADSTTIALVVANNLYPDITSLMNLLIAKRPAFEAVLGITGDLTPLVEMILMNQKSSAAGFSQRFIDKLDPSFAAAGASAQAQISAQFDKAIAAYS